MTNRLAQTAYESLPARSPQGGADDDADRLDDTAPNRQNAPDYFDQYRETPTTQNGQAPDVGAKHAQERYLGLIEVDPVNIAAPPDRAPAGTGIYPGPDGGGVGAGSLGTPVEGWRPPSDK